MDKNPSAPAADWRLIEDASQRAYDQESGKITVEKIGRQLALQRLQDNSDFYSRMTQYRLIAEGIENGVYNLDDCFCPNPECGEDLTTLLIWDNIGTECTCKSCGTRVEVAYTEKSNQKTGQEELVFSIIPATSLG